MRRALYLALALVILFSSWCFALGQPAYAQAEQPQYQSYKEIPGVTQAEISALDKLLEEKPQLVYGFIVTSDAFLYEDGSVGGFAALLCRRMSQLFGFEFELVPYAWEDLNEKLLSGEIDISGDLTSTPERLEQYLMTGAIVQRTLKIFTNQNAPGLDEAAKERTLKCAFLEGGTTYRRVADSWGLPFEPVFIDDEAKVPGMLLSGELDAFIEEGIIEASFDAHDFIKAEEYFPLTYSPVSLATANPRLEPLISVMQKYIENGGYYELTELHNQGHKDYLKNKLFGQLTSEEKAYIQNQQSAGAAILVACEIDNYPTSFYNAKEKEFQGIALDALAQIAELTGLTFQVGNEPDALWPELIEGLEHGDYSLCTELLHNSQREGRFIWPAQPYCTSNYALLSRADYPDVDINQILFSKIGLMEDAGHTDVFLEWFPDSAEVASYYVGTDEAFAALESGEIDLLMANENMLLNLTNYQEKPGYKANLMFNYSSDSFFGFNRNEEVLCSIVNKALQFANAGDITARWQRKVFDYESKMLKDIIPFAAAFTVLLLAALVVVFIVLQKNRRINKNLDKTVSQRTNELETQAAALERQLDQQRLMATLSQAFISREDMGGQIAEALRLVGEFLGVNRVLLLKNEKQALHYFGEWCDSPRGIETRRGLVLPLADEEMHLLADYSRRETSYFKLEDADGESFTRRYGLADTKNLLMLPIYMEEELWGVLEFDQCESNFPWAPSDINLGKVVAGILSGVLIRRQIEEKLIQLSSIVENSPQFITILRSGGGFVYYNPAAAEISGYSKEELDSGGMSILLGSEDYRRLMEDIVPVIVRDKKHTYELPFVVKGGQTRIMSVSAVSLEADGGIICAIASDITDLVMMQRELERQASELALQTFTLNSMFEAIPDLVFCKDLNLCFTRCNNSFKRHFNRTAEDVIGKNDLEGLGLPPQLAQRIREVDRQVMRERLPVVTEEIIPAADGSQPLFETVKVPLIQGNNVVGIMGISRDITQRKAAEETLKLTLDNLDACVYITEIETGEILFINNRMLEEYGDTDCVGKKCWEVLQRGQTQRCSFCAVPRLLERGDSECVWEEHSVVTGRYYRNTDSLIKWHDGRLVHMQHSVDITDLIGLQKDLENASKAKGDFLSRMSHEIRTPLNAVIGMINIAKSANDRAKTQDCLAKADNASKHLLGVINDILDMSKIEADKFELDRREFAFEKMLMNVTNITSFRAEEKKQNFIVHLNGNVPEAIIADDLRLSQVITNLLTNAVKFTPEHGTIILSIDKIEDSGSEVTLKVMVEDNGIGISPEQQKRLFTSFEQADGGIARKFGGTGLGLAISKRIVELMDGSIWIESELGKGSRFIFTMKAGKGKQIGRARLSEKISRENMRILAVDASLETRQYFKHVMDSLGLPCQVAANGEQALEMIQNCGGRPYNIFFIDWQMPEMNGIELTKKIKKIAADNSVVFMISVAEWDAIEEEAFAVGVRSFISKPLFPSTLVNAINGCMGLEPQKREHGAGVLQNRERENFNGHSLLIAEDVEINREIMSAILEDTGLDIDYAENGLEAVAMQEKNPNKYSLVLMDIHMPEMDGYEATRRIRAMELPGAGDIPIVAMTANVFREDVEACLQAGMNDHLGKPVDADTLFDILRKYLA